MAAVGRVAPVAPDPRLTGAFDPFAVVGDRQVLSIQDANFLITEQQSIASAAISSPRLWQLRLSGTPHTPSLDCLADDVQSDLVADVGHVFAQAEVGAFERRRRVEADGR